MTISSDSHKGGFRQGIKGNTFNLPFYEKK